MILKGFQISVLTVAMASAPALAQDADTAKQDSERSFLFAQSGEGLTVTEETIALVKPFGKTTWVTNRPERDVGQISNERFASAWDEGENSFAADPPNAVITVAGRLSAIVVLTDISVGSDEISYDYELMSGDLGEKSAPTTILIDPSRGPSGCALTGSCL
ncbi:MAG: hypothetical protein AAGH83_08600 [Pseudomonadota bacterium]